MVLRNANCKNTLECYTLKDPAPRKKGRQCRPAGQGKVPLSLRVFTSRPAIRALFETYLMIQISQKGINEQ